MNHLIWELTQSKLSTNAGSWNDHFICLHLIFVGGRVLSCHTILKGVYDPGRSRTVGLGIRGA